ncbi:MAG: bifunctional 2-C-methyl-D-erythritol 4-phosphate cytidylyltransferase/2-C-methyl-D-erythritol 2,4-cyclodiphosphate synthase [Beijerinckiaceae bacterium]
MSSSQNSQRVTALIVAAGQGTRLGGPVPKQFQALAGEAVLIHTLRAFDGHPRISSISVVIHPDHAPLYRETTAGFASPKLLPPVHGADSRQGSVCNGLMALAEQKPDIVLIHDAARPFVQADLISAMIDAATKKGCAVPATSVSDTIVVAKDAHVSAATDRTALRAVQTPQAFQFPLILAAHRKARTEGTANLTDDGSVAMAAGHAVHIVAGDPANTKITTQDDLMHAEARLKPHTTMISRTATGFDVHAFGEGDHVWLCGVKVPFKHGFIAHSDGDVALHAITDALLGAMADGDIGRHFPPSDMQWKGASSDQFLKFAVDRLRQRSGILDLIDVTIICEAPKIGPHAEAMRQRVAEIADIRISNVSVKATTTERLGFNGRGEGISALATATIRMPE